MATTLIPRSPFADLAELRERLDRVFDDLVDGRRRDWMPTVDVVEEDDRFLLRADLPGLTEDEVDVEVSDDVLTVSGKHEETAEEKKKDYLRRERRYGSFSRSMALPHGIEADDVDARFDKGVLEVAIPKPKTEEKKEKTVKIKPKSGKDE